jgi:DNA gyrase subunit B
VSVVPDEEHNSYLLIVEDRANGYPRHHKIGVEFIGTAEYRTLLASRRDIPIGEIIVTGMDQQTEETGEAPAADEQSADTVDRARRGQKDKAAEVRLASAAELVDYFITAGKKGVAINRYKGLGEMNPEQLWETTMNPEIRTLLQVRAEDHTEADLMFTTLMGDQVEPRRKFIEDNALDVKNLDV